MTAGISGPQARKLVEQSLAVVLVGLIAGAGSAVFLHGLDWAERTRGRHRWLLFLLPVAGFAIGLAYHYGANRSRRGTNLVLDELHEPHEHLPFRMGPMVLVAAVLTQVVGGSAGREGVAVLVATGLADQLPRMARRSPASRVWLLTVAMAAGFGAVFGTPIAGAVFALEMPTRGRLAPTRRLPACLAASLVGDRVTQALGIEHSILPRFPDMDVHFSTVGRVVVLAVLCGLVAVAYVLAIDQIKRLFAVISWPPLRPAIGGVALIVLTAVAGTRAYSGLSVPLADLAVAGTAVGITTFAWKLLFTATTLGSGFQGGEVTPLFVMGATMAAATAATLDLPIAAAACLGFVAVFAAASKTPLTCTILAVELFGGSALVYAAITCVVATAVAGRHTIYESQRSTPVALSS
jgi:H+/Cl- antiporter ClcA